MLTHEIVNWRSPSMVAEMIEKGEGSITIRYTAESAQEAIILSMAAAPKTKVKADITTGTWTHRPGGYVNVGSTLLDVIEQMGPPEKKE